VEGVRHALPLSRFSLDTSYLLAAGRNRRAHRRARSKMDSPSESDCSINSNLQSNGLGEACILGDWIGSPPEPS
jgi:hypothetical protein